MMSNIPALAIFHLEMAESGWLPEGVVSEHPQKGKEDRSIQEPGTCFGLTKRFE